MSLRSSVEKLATNIKAATGDYTIKADDTHHTAWELTKLLEQLDDAFDVICTMQRLHDLEEMMEAVKAAAPAPAPAPTPAPMPAAGNGSGTTHASATTSAQQG